jgi:HEAT repeat protein
VDHPRRLAELVGLLEDRDVVVRERAAATVARLAESRPERLVRAAERAKAVLADDSAYVRWHLAYALGRLALRFPARAAGFLPELAGCLEDENRVVRALSLRALADLAALRPKLVQEALAATKQGLPAPLARILQKSENRAEKRKRTKG